MKVRRDKLNTESRKMNYSAVVPATMPDAIVANMGVFVFLCMRDRKRKSKPSSAIA